MKLEKVAVFLVLMVFFGIAIFAIIRQFGAGIGFLFAISIHPVLHLAKKYVAPFPLDLLKK